MVYWELEGKLDAILGREPHSMRTAEKLEAPVRVRRVDRKPSTFMCAKRSTMSEIKTRTLFCFLPFCDDTVCPEHPSDVWFTW